MAGDLYDDVANEGDAEEAVEGLHVEEEEHSGGNDDDAQGNGADEADKDSSEEEEEGDNEYDLTDKFIAQDNEEEDEGEASDRERERKRRHKRRRERTPELDEEDYQLLEDNQVTGIRRKQKSSRKRIRKQRDTQNKTDAQRLQEELFGAEVGALEEDDAQEDQKFADAGDDFEESDDEMAGFIDDDDMGRRASRSKARNLPMNVSSQGIQEMQDIFGDVDDLLEMYAEKKAAAVLRDEEGGETAVPVDEDGAEALEEDAAQQDELRRQKQKVKRMEAVIEPELMEKLMIQPVDDRIRQRDAPERYQISGEAELRDAFSDAQLDDAARWILQQLVGPALLVAAEKAADHHSSSRQSRACCVLEEGILEVDGKPRDGRPRRQEKLWDRDELEDGLTDLSRGTRGLKKQRSEQGRAAWRHDASSRQAAAQAIAAVLKEMWNQQHEIPVIACYRKQLCGELLGLRAEDRPGLTSDREARRRREAGKPDFKAGTVQAKHRRFRRWDVLWAVHDLAAKWRALVRRKEKRSGVFKAALGRCQALEEDREGSPDPQLTEVAEAIQGCLNQLPEATSMEDLDDIDAKFRLATSGHTEDVFEDVGPGVRRPQRSSAYPSLKKAGLDSVVHAMAMSAADFGDNLDRVLKRNAPQDSRIMPADLAYEHVVEEDPAFDGPEKVLERARQIHVSEIVSEPHVRAFIRGKLDEHMIITTAPTLSGESQLDAFHPYGRVKRLRRMPAVAFKGRDDYLRINLAEKEGLIAVVNEVEGLEELLVQPMLEYYKSSAVSAVSKEWNNLRHMILREAVQRLVPQLQHEANSRLQSQAREVVVEEFMDRLWGYASNPPVQMKSEDGEVVERRRLAACCWGEGRSATCIVMLDEEGSLVDVLYLPSFSGLLHPMRPGVEYNIAHDPKKSADVNRVVEFCRENRPQAIFVGARNQSCKALKEDMSQIGDFILDAHAQILTSGHDTGSIEVCFAEETLATLWANSTVAKDEFPEHPDVVRRAVALGRLALEPLAVLAALCRPDSKEILSLNLHSLQTHVPEAELLRAAEVVLMTAVAQVGADINLMAANSWQASMLPYVAGLGPRKAQSLLQAVQAHEYALTRISLWNDIWKPGNAVFRNCGGFLKITARARSLVNAEVEAVDSARIEPLSYRLAFEVARAAMGSTSQNREEDLINVNKAMTNPERVEELNLEELHDRLAAESSDPASFNQISALVDIAMEFIMPCMELRPGNALEKAQQRESQFWWMYGETPETLKPGRRVEALVRYVGQGEARCALPEISGLDATLSASDISASGPVVPSDHLKPGQSVAARIKAIRPEEFCVELTTASTDLNDDARWEEKYSKEDNPFYHSLSQEERRAMETEKRRQARNKVLAKRTIDHPNFKNVSVNEAVKLLEKVGVGEAIFRPSPKGLAMICLTMKLHSSTEGEDLIVHKDVKEGPKRGGQLTLGTPLTMITTGNKTEERFEDLDEILARYAEPLAEKVQQVVTHRKFREGIWEDIKERLHSEGVGMRGTAVYCLCVEYLHPGFFYIGSVLPTANRTPRREFFSISPEGFYFRRKVHKDVERMLAVYKRNPMGSERTASAPPVNLAPPPLQAPPVGQYVQPPYYPPQQGGYGYQPATFNPQQY